MDKANGREDLSKFTDDIPDQSQDEVGGGGGRYPRSWMPIRTMSPVHQILPRDRDEA